MSLTLTSEPNLRPRVSLEAGNLAIPQFSFLVLLATLAAIAADQFAAPTLYSSSPLWAVFACAALVWRRGGVGLSQETEPKGSGLSADREAGSAGFAFSNGRVALFVAGHVLLVSAARILQGTLGPVAGTLSAAGWIIAALKLSVLLPTLFFLPLKRWRILANIYAAEGVAGLVVLVTFFPERFLVSIWPWYGQLLGKSVLIFSRIFVHGLSYTGGLTPTIQGSALEVTILQACSGISGVVLFDYLFALVALLDWNRLRKGRTLAAYFAGIVAMLVGNGLRIASFVILGNRGFADTVVRFHLSAGWFFFSVVFLVYLALTYRKLLRPTVAQQN